MIIYKIDETVNKELGLEQGLAWFNRYGSRSQQYLKYDTHKKGVRKEDLETIMLSRDVVLTDSVGEAIAFRIWEDRGEPTIFKLNMEKPAHLQGKVLDVSDGQVCWEVPFIY